MAKVFPVDDFVTDEWYPGFDPDSSSDALRAFEWEFLFSKDDEQTFWSLDFHQPRGLVPLAWIVMEYGPLWASQVAAEAIPLPASRGLRVRMVGPHVYASEVPVTSEREIAIRTERVTSSMPRLIASFPETWAERVKELEAWYAYLERADPTGASLEEIERYFEDAVTYLRRAWEIHFEVMYPLVANYVGFQGLCSELGVDPDEVPRFLQGYETKITEADRELWRLARGVREAGLVHLFAETPAEDLAAALAAAGESASAWRGRFERFLDAYGWRTEGIMDPGLAPWIEDPTSPLGTIKTFLLADGEHDFEAAQRAAVEEREAAIERARAGLTIDEQARFDAALESCRHANFTWWNEEHNFYIDLRCHIPLRRAALALARAVGAENPNDVCFLFSPEIRALFRRERAWPDLLPLIAERRAYFEAWHARRPDLPRVLGTVPEGVADPVVKEIYGMGPHYFEALEAADEETATLVGLPASSGVTRGRARLVRHASDLHAIVPGEILVCEATSPNWTPAFTKIAACVCDQGGSLTHASIVSREYRIPCVTGCAVATTVIRTGDELEVDGSRGIVTVLRRAPAGETIAVGDH